MGYKRGRTKLGITPSQYVVANKYGRLDYFESRTGSYRFGAKRLMSMVPVTEGLVYDVGCGTGNSTIEVLKRFQCARVIGIDSSMERLKYARAKFGFGDSTSDLRELCPANDAIMLSFLRRFGAEAKESQNRVEFQHADILQFNGTPGNAVIGARVFHWLKPQAEVAKKFFELLNAGGYVAISSSMSHYVSVKFGISETSYIFHPFTQSYLEVLSRKIEEETGKPPKRQQAEEKKHPDETISLFRYSGFELIAYDEVRLPGIDRMTLLEHSLWIVPEHFGMFEDTGLVLEVRHRLISNAIWETLLKHRHELPPKDVPSDTCPIFIFRKK